MHISPFFIQNDFISIRWYGLLIAIAILISYFLALREIKKSNIKESKFDSIFLITVLAGIIGARLAFVLQNLSYYPSHLNEIFAIWDGGLSIHGAIILGVLALLVSTKLYRVSFFSLANIISPYLLLSGAIGRWGNYFNQEIIGKPSSSFLKMFVPLEGRPHGFENFTHFYPVFLFESILLFLAFIIYLLFKKKLEKYALVYTLIIYSFTRIIVEFWRIDYKPIFFHLDLAQIVSFGIIIVGVVVGLTFRHK